MPFQLIKQLYLEQSYVIQISHVHKIQSASSFAIRQDAQLVIGCQHGCELELRIQNSSERIYEPTGS